MRNVTLSIGETTIDNPGADDVVAALRTLGEAGDPDLSLMLVIADSDDSLIAHFAEGLGFYVSGAEDGGREYRTAVLGSDHAAIEVWLAGDSGRYQRRVFLSDELTKAILSEYAATGRFLGACEWVPAEDVCE